MFLGSVLRKRGSNPASSTPGLRSSAKLEAGHPPQPALRGLVMKSIWPVSCWAACCFFTTAVVYTCADIWKWKMMQFKSETAYVVISVLCGLILYGMIESILQKSKLCHWRRCDRKMILISKMLIDTIIHLGLISDVTKFPSSDHRMWHHIALSWGSGVTSIASTILGRPTVEDPTSGFTVLVAAFQPLTLFLINGQKWFAVYCSGGACLAFFVVAFLSVT